VPVVAASDWRRWLAVVGKEVLHHGHDAEHSGAAVTATPSPTLGWVSGRAVVRRIVWWCYQRQKLAAMGSGSVRRGLRKCCGGVVACGVLWRV